ncbi:periplasmic polyamine-binding protein of ABC transporter [cyanobacterium endosymbiont of Rhopalodia gibberula]|uniref:extracellular solute-binding protein n=1 Tax=cyanobacterium endosymbiont of Rhopalodia gibberula TaxID=1763363 RepID=UPI000DC6F4F7|nr:extracellular solute-binding protein [cyanobacterium endosymbiont of Rhopalodia gibberula]BBA79176.1 periplasmic polyamine-binding protein of ABC transporter [cyanobacterium endosymbiont of Rhopalodia gibberula]
MLSRRSFLRSAGTLTLTQLLSGCDNQSTALRVLLLQGSIPPQLLKAFRQQFSKDQSLSFKPTAQLKDLWKQLQSWQVKNRDPQGLKDWLSKLPLIDNTSHKMSDLVTLGDTWLEKAIQDKLIQPLSLTEIANWQKLGSRWQALVKRDEVGNLDLQGQIWGAPYRWGTTLIAYHSDQFETLGWTPTNWGDLWREELRHRIAVVDQPREIIGLTLKKLGYSYNSPNLSQIPNLSSQLQALNQQVKYYSSRYYLQPLIIGDVWLSVGWSSDILPLIAKNRKIKAIIPKSGTSIWTDIWVQPRAKENNIDLSTLTKQWIDFCWQESSVNQISLLTDGASPMIHTIPTISAKIKTNPLLFIDKNIMNNCDFIEPLSELNKQEYKKFWKEMRKSEKGE